MGWGIVIRIECCIEIWSLIMWVSAVIGCLFVCFFMPRSGRGGGRRLWTRGKSWSFAVPFLLTGGPLQCVSMNILILLCFSCYTIIFPPLDQMSKHDTHSLTHKFIIMYSSSSAPMETHSNLPISDWPASLACPMVPTRTRWSRYGIAPRNSSWVHPVIPQPSMYGASDASLPKWPPDCHYFPVGPTLINWLKSFNAEVHPIHTPIGMAWIDCRITIRNFPSGLNDPLLTLYRKKRWGVVMPPTY